MKIWVEPTRDDAERVLRAVAAFGAPTHGVTADDFADPHAVFQIGESPRRVDLVCSIDAVAFETAWTARETMPLDNIQVSAIGLGEMLVNNEASWRSQHLADAEVIRELLARRRRRWLRTRTSCGTGRSPGDRTPRVKEARSALSTLQHGCMGSPGASLALQRQRR